MSLPDELKEYRLDHDLSWEQLAERVSMSAAGLWKLVNRKTTPRERTERRIRRLLNLWPAGTRTTQMTVEDQREVVSDGL